MAGLFLKGKSEDRKGTREWLFVETSLLLFVESAVKIYCQQFFKLFHRYAMSDGRFGNKFLQKQNMEDHPIGSFTLFATFVNKINRKIGAF